MAGIIVLFSYIDHIILKERFLESTATVTLTTTAAGTKTTTIRNKNNTKQQKKVSH